MQLGLLTDRQKQIETLRKDIRQISMHYLHAIESGDQEKATEYNNQIEALINTQGAFLTPKERYELRHPKAGVDKELEAQIAKYPSIVIDREHHDISHELRNASFAKPEAKLVLHDEDGWPFINYFEGGIEYGFMIPSETTTFLKAHHELLLEQLARPDLDDRVREKLEWASRAEAAAWPRCQKMYELAVALVMAKALIPASPKPAGHDLWIKAVGPETVKALLSS